jgi:tRNA-splicing ligase RtcB
MEADHETLTPEHGVPVKMWTKGVPVEAVARQQLFNIAGLPIVRPWVAVMPDVHYGIGATVGSVIPTQHAIIPAAVGVDIGCGMLAVQTTIRAERLPDNLAKVRAAIEKAVPHGRSERGRDHGAWGEPPSVVDDAWSELCAEFDSIADKHRTLARSNHRTHLGTLGTGNHFIEICIDEADQVWVMLHSGSRGVGNAIGRYFIELARRDMERQDRQLPDANLAYLEEGSPHFADYVEAVGWAQRYAAENRRLMLQATLAAMKKTKQLPKFALSELAVDCHHNYVQQERHFDMDLYVTRKGAVRAGLGELGIVPGSMGTQSYIVRGRGNPDSFCSCSHGAGRAMSRNEARSRFTLKDHRQATLGVECRKDREVLDETPGAYKSIDAVMHAQRDLVEVLHTLKQVVCVKG